MPKSNPDDESPLILARRPRLALGKWKRLPGQQRQRVIDLMAAEYGRGFAATFRAVTENPRLRDTEVTTITNRATAVQLSGQGFKLARTDYHWKFAKELWVAPTGKEVWRQPGTGAAVPVASGALKQLADLRQTVEELKKWKGELERLLPVAAVDPGQEDELFGAFRDWVLTLDNLLGHGMPDQVFKDFRGTADADALRAVIKQCESLLVWKADFPKAVQAHGLKMPDFVEFE